MTRKCNDKKKSTPFGLWLRDQDRLESGNVPYKETHEKCYCASNLDYIWSNYKSCEWMFLEEKTHMAMLKFGQARLFKKIDRAVSSDPTYRGFWCVTFENTTPENGRVWLQKHTQSISDWSRTSNHTMVEVTSDELVEFLQFAGPLHKKPEGVR